MLTTQACCGSSKMQEDQMRKGKKKRRVKKNWFCIEKKSTFAKNLGTVQLV